MKVRIKFDKTGALVYIGHLDVMRYFQKLFRRASLPVKYSEGFSPHQILSFTPPLPLGMESFGEYADVELTEKITTEDAIRRLRCESVPEINIYSFKELPERCENAMASVKAAAYSVSVKNSELFDRISAAIPAFLEKDVVNVTKKTKKSEKEINIRPLIYNLSSEEDLTVNMLISSGSVDNIKPELVLDALSVIYEADDLIISRLDQYTEIDGRFVSLDDIGTDIL